MGWSLMCQAGEPERWLLWEKKVIGLSWDLLCVECGWGIVFLYPCLVSRKICEVGIVLPS